LRYKGEGCSLEEDRINPRWLVIAALAAAGVGATCEPWGVTYECAPEAQAALFERRILPLLEEERPSSCNQCHLSGVDLSLWFKGDACQTMTCMIHEGLVDLASPDSSLVLQWIDRADPASPLIDARVLAEERAGVLGWIEMTAACGACAGPEAFGGDPCQRGDYDPIGNDCGVDEEDLAGGYAHPGDCSDATLEQLFQDTFFPIRRRCYPCHFETFDGLEEAPKWIAVGPCDVASLETMRNVIARGFIDREDPAQSLWILKPLDDVNGGVEHTGGPKFHARDDPAAIAMTYFATRWAECQTE
jgi:hypothetical protein